MSKSKAIKADAPTSLSCPSCQCKVVARRQRSTLTKWFSKQKHYICRSCHTTFREDGSIIRARNETNKVIDL